MTRKESPQSKFSYFGIVVNAKKESNNPRQELLLTTSKLVGFGDFFVATIIHDKDTLDNGNPKIIHAHAFIEVETKLTKKQMLNELANRLMIDINQISVEGSNNPYLLGQYLIHKNDLKKTQYDRNLIETNNIEKLNEIIDEQKPTKESKQAELLEHIKRSNTITELTEKVGLELTNKYRSIFNQIKQEQRLDYESLTHIRVKYYALLETLNEKINFGVYFDNSDKGEFYETMKQLIDRYKDEIDTD